MRIYPSTLSAITLFRLWSVIVLMLTALSPLPSYASTVSETFIFLKENGRDYLLQRSMRTQNNEYDFFVDKKIVQDSFFYIDPNQFEWDESNKVMNRLHFNTGNFVVMYPEHLDSEVSVDDKGIFTFNSWDGKKQENGHFGMWNTPDNFSRFTYAWFFPETMEIIAYNSNRKGEWVIRNNTLSFFASDTNDVTFTIRYREKDSDSDGVVNSHDRCPDTKKDNKVNASGCETDSDQDGIVDSLDQCPDSAKHAVIDTHGCELDFDNDGVINSKDQCSNSPTGAKVNDKGCEIDSDNDGIIDRKDQCPDTSAGIKVNHDGCEIDSDNDGVVDSKDHCPATPKCVPVNENGCEIDSDNDGILDSKDQCPNTPTGAKVNENGCEIDSDNDGIVDSRDQCPNTPAGAKVNSKGCELDSDNDGILETADLCPATEANVEVDYTGCEKSAPIVLKGVNFHTASAELTTESRAILDNVASSLRQHTTIKLEIAGHTDAMGDDSFNLQLSQARAESVLNYLAVKGMATSLLSAKGYGETQPIADNATASGRTQNRRVELNRMPE